MELNYITFSPSRACKARYIICVWAREGVGGWDALNPPQNPRASFSGGIFLPRAGTRQAKRG